LLLGGYSAGFTLGGTDNLYVGLQFYKGDFEGVRNMILHEAFHNVQSSLAPPRNLAVCLTAPERSAYEILSNTFTEGTAEYVADVWAIGPQAPYAADLQKHLAINQNPFRQRDTERLLSFLVLNALDGKETPDVVASLLFDYNWNNAGYYYGYKMMKAIAGKRGNGLLASYLLNGGPTAFFADYLALDQNKVGEGGFSDRFPEAISALHTRVRSCPVEHR
jgi:hypothetical protein